MTKEERIEMHYQTAIDYCQRNGYELLSDKSEIKDRESLLKIKCPKHGIEEKRVFAMKQNKLCWHCSRELALQKKSITTQQQRCESLYNRGVKMAKQKGYDFLTQKEEIKKNISLIQYCCPTHGIHSMRIANFLSGKGCPDCAKDNARKRESLSLEEVLQKISACGGVCLNAEEYINNTVKNLKVLCPRCNEPFVTSLRNFCQHDGQVCENCSDTMSIGEFKIKQYLDVNNYNYEYQKWFDDCRDKKPLPFDFYLPEFNMIIEYDGEQHFKDRGYKTGMFSDTLEYTKKHDAIKTKYCKDNNIKLYRIPYYHKYKIENLLNEYLHEDIV